MNSGPSQSVYQLNTAGLTELPVAPRPLAPGQSIKLPDGAGTLTFTGYRQWISLAITYDPGQLPALIAGLAALAGLLLSFFVRRRRDVRPGLPGARRPHRGRRGRPGPVRPGGRVRRGVRRAGRRAGRPVRAAPGGTAAARSPALITTEGKSD